MNAQLGFARQQSGEAAFSFEELFYSRTDDRGVIRAGNDVFQRISGFEWADLINAPHKIVRHPDTPRAVFRILWDALKKGNPMGAYVKNRTRSGEFYWVFAVVLPVDDGYLSVRLKPSSPLFERVRAYYEAFSDRERLEKIDPENGAGELRGLAAASGFSSYTSFMAFALGQELAARDARLRRVADGRTGILVEMNEALEKATKEQVGLLRSFEALQSIPNNMRIVASRLEPSGGPVSAISENYKASSLVISERLRSFVAGKGNLCDQMSREVARALFLLGCGRVVSEMNRNFVHMRPVTGIDWDEERGLLERLESSCAVMAREAMSQAAELATALNRASAEIRRQMLGLDTIRVLGRVECGRMRDTNGGLSATIDQLDSFHADIKSRLESIMRLSEVIGTAMTSYLRAEAR
jgi:aerotaxis receptor